MKFLFELFVLILVQTNCLARAGGGYDDDHDEHEEYEIVCKTSNTGRSHSLGRNVLKCHGKLPSWLFMN